MPAKKQTSNNQQARLRRRSRKPDIEQLALPAEQQTDPATLIQPAKFDRGLATARDVMQLQGTIGNQAVGKLLSRAAPMAQRQQLGNPVIQRVLDVGNTVAAADVATLTKVHNKVWILQGHGPDSVVIKIEVPGESKQKFQARHAHITWLAQKVLPGVPNSVAMADTEVAQLGLLQLPEAGGRGKPTLQSMAAAPGNMVFLKVETVAMAENLADKITAANGRQGQAGGGNQATDPAKQAALQQLMTNPATLQALGKMAAFDLLVNNGDRFKSHKSSSGFVNQDNIDFNNAGQAVAIDNLDPNNKIDANNWPGQDFVLTGVNRQGYSTLAVIDMLRKVGGITINVNTLKPHIDEFRTGMEEAVTDIKAQAQLLKFKALKLTGPKREISDILAKRIDDLKP